MPKGLPKEFSARAGVAAALIGAAVLLGWALDVDLLKRLHSNWPTMKPNTALGLLMAGLSLAALGPAHTTRPRRIVGRMLAALLAILATLTLASYVFGLEPGIDELIYQEQPSDFDSPAPGRMAHATALSFLLLALALAGLDWQTRNGQRPAQYLGLLGSALCLVTLLGYLYSTPASHRFYPFSSVALHTALASSVLWMGIPFARSRTGFMAEITSQAEGGGLARRLLPTAIAACVLLGFARVAGERAGLYGMEFGVALFATANILVFGSLVWEGAQWLNRLDADRERAHQERALSDERYRRFFEQNLAGFCIVRPDGTFADCNPAFLRIFGFESRQKALAANIAELYVDPASRPVLWNRLLQERQLRGLELEMKRRDGQPVTLVADVVAEFGPSGELVETRTYVQDVTEHRRVELQLQRAQKMEAVGQLAGGIAHDFNNLLGVMGGSSELLLRELGSAHPAARRVQAIQKAVERAAGLTRQLLTFSRHQPVETRICDLNKIVEDVEKLLRRLLGEDVRLVVALDRSIGRVRGDVGQIEQVIVNLAVNARDAMPEGGRLIIETGQVELDESYVRVHPEAHAGQHVLLAVSDAGQGMDPQTISRIFDPFFTTKAPGKGTGLGLAMVYGIVKRFGGSVAVYSEPGRGSTFKVYLPSIREPEEPPEREAAIAAEPPGGSEVILLVEDEEALRDVFAEVLRARGYDVLEAADAEAALEVAANAGRSIDLLLTDIVLPSRSGPRTAAELQARFPGIRVLYMSGYTDRAAMDNGQVPQASHFLQKPFTPEALLWRVRAVLDEGKAS